MENIVKKISSSLYYKNILLYDDKDWFEYSLLVLIYGLINVFVILFVGIIFNDLKTSICFFLVFSSVRRFTGGYHSKTPIKCNIILAFLSMFCILYSSIWFNTNINSYLMKFNFYIGNFIICIYAPIVKVWRAEIIDNVKKRYTFKLIAVLIFNMWIMLSNNEIFNLVKYRYAINFSLFVIIILMLLSINNKTYYIRRKEDECEENK